MSYDFEVAAKVSKLRSLSNAIVEAREINRKTPCYEAALNVQQLERQRDELRALLPPLTAVGCEAVSQA